MSDREILLNAFAESIHAKACALTHPKLTPTGRARLLESISDDIKKFSNFVEPEVSQAALERAASLLVDLRSKGWHEQPQFDPDREVFHWEHVSPVSAIRKACIDAPSVVEVADVLRATVRVAWILKDEDRKLTRLGYRSRRADPVAAYAHAEIVLVPRADPS